MRRAARLLGTLLAVAAFGASAASAQAAGTTSSVFTASTSAGGATGVVWGFRFEPGSGYAGTITISVPGQDVFSGVTEVVVTDMTTGAASYPGYAAGANGSSLSISAGQLAAGDVVAVDVAGVVNPPSGTAFSSISISPSATPLAASGSFTAAQSISDLTFSPSTAAAGATGVTWGIRFRTSSTGALAAGGSFTNTSSITITAPAGGQFSANQLVDLIDLTTGVEQGVTITLSNGNRTVTLVPQYHSIPAGDVVQLEAYDNTNPASGTPFSGFTVATSSDPSPVHPGSGAAFTAAQSVSGVSFSPSSAAGSATATWALAFQASSSGRVTDNGAIVIAGPPGTTFPTGGSQYSLTDLTTGGSFSPTVVTSNGGATASLSLPTGFGGDDIRAGDEVAIDVQGVTNPSGGVSASEVSVSTSSDPASVSATAAPSSPSGSVAGLQVFQSTTAAGATGVVWTALFAASGTGGLPAGTGTATFVVPAGTFESGSAVATLMDLTTDELVGQQATPTSSGQVTVTANPGASVAPGDLVELQVTGATNPAAGSYPASDFAISTSADTTPASPQTGVTVTAAQAATDVSVLQNTAAGSATQTTWTALLTASSTGGMAWNSGASSGQVTVSLPGTVDASNACVGVWDLATGAGENCSGLVTLGRTSVSINPNFAVAPGDPLVLLMIGVVSPSAGNYPASSVSVTTSSDLQAASPAGGFTLTAPNLPATDVLQGTDPAGSASDDNLITEFVASPTGAVSGTLFEGTATLTALTGTSYPSSTALELDLTTGESRTESVSANGAAATVPIDVPIGAGDVVELAFYGVTNPAGGLTTPAGFSETTSSDAGQPAVTGDSFSGTEGAPATGATITVNGTCPASGTIGWGDGSPSSAATIVCQGLIAQLVGTHTYHDFGTYTTTGTTGPWTGSGSALIGDAPISASPVTGLTATAGGPFTGTVAHFTDTNPYAALSDFSASLDWGDGSTSADTSVTASGTGFDVQATHIYTTPQTATVVVTVHDAGGSSSKAVESVTVNPPGAPAVTLTQPANGSTVATATPTFSGAAGTGVADSPQITVEIYAGGAVSSLPLATLTTTASGGAWSVTPAAPLANGTYTAQAQQSTTTGIVGKSSATVFTINAPPPPPPPPPPPTNPGTGGGPPAGCNTEVKFDLIDAIGCLQAVVDTSQIPSAEDKALCKQLSLASDACDKQLSQEIKSGSPPLIASAIVRVNGLDLTPDPGAVVVLDPKSGWVVTSGATVQIMGDVVTLYDGALVLDGASGGDVKALDIDLDKLIKGSSVVAQALSPGGFKLTGTLKVTLQQYATNLDAAVTLPSIFSSVGIGGSLSAEVSATADDQDNVQFDELYFAGPTLSFSGFKLSNVAFCYQNHISDGFCQKKTGVDFGSADGSSSSWNATAKVSVLGVTIDAAPPPPTYGIGFVNGSFDFAGASATFPGTGIPLGDSGAFLTKVGGSFALDPTRITGEIGLRVASILSIDGNLFLVFPQNGQQYTFTGTELGSAVSTQCGTNTVPALGLPTPTVSDFAIAAGGSVGVNIPYIGNLTLGHGYLLYAYPSYVAAGGGVCLTWSDSDLGLSLAAYAAMSGQFNFGNGEFNIEGDLGGSLSWGSFISGSINLEAAVSSTGFGACGSVTTSLGSVSGGAGVIWSQGLGGFSAWLGSCDLSPYETAVSASAARAARSGYQLNLPGGLPSEMVKLIGSGGAPDVTVTGPGGIDVSTDGGLQAARMPVMIGREPAVDTTYVAILHPPAGRYTISANPGSPAIARVLTAHTYTPEVHARVGGSGTRRRLTYSFNAQPGEKVTFVERGSGVDRQIGIAERAHGTLEFTSAPGPAGTRQIVAIATVDGQLVIFNPHAAEPGELVVASYRAAGPTKLGAVRKLSARRHGTHLLVSFERVRGAKSYALLIALADGLRTDYVLTSERLNVVVPTVGPLAGRVTVRALGDNLTTKDGPETATNVTLPRVQHKRHKPPRHHKRRHG